MDANLDESASPLSKFKAFVSAILTVTKDDIQKVEDQATDIVRPLEPDLEE